MNEGNKRRMKAWEEDEDVKKIMTGRCIICGTKIRVQFHHVRPLERRFSIRTFMKDYAYTAYNKLRLINEMLKCVELCKPHHGQVDATIRQIEGEERITWENLSNILPAMLADRLTLEPYMRTVQAIASLVNSQPKEVEARLPHQLKRIGQRVPLKQLCFPEIANHSPREDYP